MKHIRVLKAIGTAAAAGALALLLLTLFCLVYFNVPVHYDNKDGGTDYKWEPNKFYSRWTEGFSFGKTNNEGFNNPFDRAPDDPVDVLVMGSSHMEGFQLRTEDSVAAKLGNLLPGKTVYNIGISGHDFPTCCCNFEAALETYRPACAVIETASCLFGDSALDRAVQGTVPEIASHNGGLTGILQRNQFLRLLYTQMTHYLNKRPADTADAVPAAAAENAAVNDAANNEALLSALLEKLRAAAEKHGAKVVVLYHPALILNADGTLTMNESRAAVDQVAAVCAENGIAFLDMGARFRRDYEETRLLPYGFINTPAGSGHLNAHGCALIADELFRLLGEVG